jgi:hypothetical protein
MFVLTNVIGMLISAGRVWAAKYLLEIDGRTELLAAGVFGTVLATVVRFFAYRFLVFNAELDAEPEFAHDHEIFEHEEEHAPSQHGRHTSHGTEAAPKRPEAGSTTER